MSVENGMDAAAAIRRRASYALAAGAAVAGATSDASGAVFYSGLQEISIGHGLKQTLQINDDDYDDITLKNYVFSNGNYQGIFIPFSPGAVVSVPAAGWNYAVALNAGSVIDQAALGSFQVTMAHGAQAPHGQFDDAVNKYIGFAFPVGPTDLYYAWMRVTTNQAAGTFVIHDWAWESEAGVAITAGAGGLGDFDVNGVVDGNDFLVWQRSFVSSTGSPPDEGYDEADLADWKSAYGNGSAAVAAVQTVPEPGTLGFLAAGAGGVELLRRRQRRDRS